jgi:hypothetical protein
VSEDTWKVTRRDLAADGTAVVTIEVGGEFDNFGPQAERAAVVTEWSRVLGLPDPESPVGPIQPPPLLDPEMLEAAIDDSLKAGEMRHGGKTLTRVGTVWASWVQWESPHALTSTVSAALLGLPVGTELYAWLPPTVEEAGRAYREAGSDQSDWAPKWEAFEAAVDRARAEDVEPIQTLGRDEQPCYWVRTGIHTCPNPVKRHRPDVLDSPLAKANR